MQRMVGAKVHPVRQNRDFFVGVQAFHRQPAPAVREQVAGQDDKFLEIGKSAGSDDIESGLRPEILDPACLHKNITQP